MPIITVNLEQEHLDQLETTKRRLRGIYGLRINRSEIIRRAIRCYLSPVCPTDSPEKGLSVALAPVADPQPPV